jgi:hypothetical protein
LPVFYRLEAKIVFYILKGVIEKENKNFPIETVDGLQYLKYLLFIPL